jgi:hypothetical protein
VCCGLRGRTKSPGGGESRFQWAVVSTHLSPLSKKIIPELRPWAVLLGSERR